MQRLAWAALLLVAVLPPPAAAQQLPTGPLKLPGPDGAMAGTAAAAAEQGQLGRFVEPVQPAEPAAEPGAAASGRRSVQAAAAAAAPAAGAAASAQQPASSVLPGQHSLHADQPASAHEQQPSPGRTAAQGRLGPISRSLGEERQQVAGPLTLPGPGQRGSGQLVNQQVAAGGSPAAERATAADSQDAVVQGRNTRRLLVAPPLTEALGLALPPAEEAAAAAAAPPPPPPAAEQPASPFALVLPAAPKAAIGQPPAAEEEAAAEQPPATEAAAAAPEEQTPFEGLFPGVTPAELRAAPAPEATPAEAVGGPPTTAVPGPGSEEALLAEAELALSGPTGNASVPAFPAAGGSTGAPPGTPAGPEAQPPAGTPGSNFSSLISLLDPPPSFQMPPLSPQQQDNLPKLKQLRQGIGTVSVWRNVGNFGGTQMACGMGFLSDYFKDFFVALPTALYRSGELCGACVRLWCVDSVCQDALVRNASFMVTDSCKDCTGNSLLVSEQGFTNLTGVNVNISPKLQIAWTFESCAPLIQGGIRMLASKNNGPAFLSYNFSNLRQLLKTVTLGGVPFTRTAYGAWELNSPGKDIAIPQTGAELVLTSVDGQRISKRLRSLGSQDLGINFA